MKVYLFSDYLKVVNSGELSDDQVICEIAPINEFPDGLCEIGGKLARVCMFVEGESVFIEYVKKPQKDSEVYGSSEIKCPHCGYESTDSWEADDSDDNHDCSNCGSVFSYERYVEVSYNSTIVKRNNNITKLKLAEEQSK